MMNELALIPFVDDEGHKKLIGVNQLITVSEVNEDFMVYVGEEVLVGKVKDNVLLSKIMELFHSDRFTKVMEDV